MKQMQRPQTRTVVEETHAEEDGPMESSDDISSCESEEIVTEEEKEVSLTAEQEQLASKMMREVLETPNSKKKYKTVVEVI